MPDWEHAIVDVGKLRDYCLNPQHPEGRHKARVFGAALGIGRDDAEWLAGQILERLPEVRPAACESTAFGERYDVDVPISRSGKNAVVRTGWIVRKTDDRPRLVACFVR